MNRYVVLFLVAVMPYCLHGQTQPRSLPVEHAIAVALENNPAVRAADAGISAARGRFWSGLSLPSPEISVAHDYIPRGMGLGAYAERSVGITQMFDFPTQYVFKASVLSHDEAIARAMGRATRQRLVARVRNAYASAWGARRKLLYASDNCALSDSIFAKAEVRARVGEASPLERLTAQVQRSEARNELLIARNEVATAYADLNDAMGFHMLAYDTSVVLTDSVVVIPRSLGIEEYLARAEAENPQMQIARSRIGSASSSRILAWSSLLPTFTVSFFQQARDGQNGYYGASIGASFPLWFMLDTRGKVEEAQAGVAAADADLEVTRNAVFAEIRSAYSSLLNNELSLRLYQTDMNPQAEEVYRMAARGYASGDLSYLEYLQARVTLLATRRNYVSALLNYTRSLTTLEELTGAGDDLHENEVTR